MELHKKYLECQKQKIEIEKWLEGEKIHNDPGEEYILKWIEKNAKKFREVWENSDCKDCNNWKKCGAKLRISCHEFIN